VRHLLPLIAVGLLVGGCGGDGGQDRAGPPEGREPLESVLRRFERTMGSTDCKELAEFLDIKSQRLNPDEPAAPDTCENFRRLSKDLEGFNVTRSVRYGSTAAHVDGTGKGTGPNQVVNTTWLVDYGRWRMLSVSRGSPQVGTRPRPGAKFDRHMRDWVAAARKRDCNTLWRLAEATSRFAEHPGGKAGYCRSVSDAYTRPERGFLRDLADDRSAEPKLLGGSFAEVFYGLDLENGRYTTLILSAPPTLVSKGEARGHDPPGVRDYITAQPPRGD
jgi:hypothetical protein